MDLTEMQRRAVAATAVVVAAVRPEQLGDPTPCSDWDVRTVLNHLVATNWNFAARAEGKEPEPHDVVPDVIGDDPAAAYEASARAVTEAWADPASLDRIYVGTSGEVQGRMVVGIHTVDTLVHGWDVARATGQDYTIDPELAGPALAMVSGAVPDAARGPGKPFGPEVDVPDDAPVGDRLVAFLGRRP